MKYECEICAGDFSKSKIIDCGYCDLKACRDCNKKYLLSRTDEIHCMGCRNKWNLEFCHKNLTKKFINGEYKRHQTELLFQTEKSRFPETMPLVEDYLEIKRKRTELAEIKREERELVKKLRELRDRKYKIDREIFNLEVWGNRKKKPNEENRVFIRPCSVNGCRGFLSTKWKCGVCQEYTCSKCFETKDEHHVCHEDNLKSAEMIRRETRNCPSCGVNIFKIDGCFAGNTEILLWNGNIKLAKDIQVGDVLVGTDGKQRIVKKTFSGNDEMYCVQQKNGVDYTVNSKHTLLLLPSFYKRITESDSFFKLSWFDSQKVCFKQKKIYFSDDNYETVKKEIEKFQVKEEPLRIIVDDYLKLPLSIKNRLYGYKSNEIYWDEKYIEIDPYILGTWLGDGYSDGSGFSSNDNIIINEWIKWANRNDAEIVHTASYRFSVRRNGAGYKRGAIGEEKKCIGCQKIKCTLCTQKIDYNNRKKKSRHSTSPLKELLNKYNLVHNKHIPNVYLTNSRKNRLLLLAGIIDTDGYIGNDGKRIVITQVNPILSKQIEILARSLGFIVNVTISHKINIKVPNCNIRKNYKDQYKINISGYNISEIPVILKKKCINFNPNKNYLKTSINVKWIGNDKYYGFQIDGNNQFILSDSTAVKNCDQMWCVKCQVAFSWNTGLRVTGVVHNPHYYEWRRNGGQAIRNAGELHCGGIPDFRRYEKKIYKDQEVPNSVIYRFPSNFSKNNIREYVVSSTYTTYQSMLEDIHRAVLHFQDIILTRQRRECNVLIDNQKMRIEYLANDLSEEKMKKKLIQRKIQENRNRAILDVYELLNTVWTESMLQIYNHLSVKTVQDEIQRMTRVTILANRELIKISQMYNTRVIVFAHNFLHCLDSPRTFTKKYIKEIEDGTRSHQYVRKELNFATPPLYKP